MTQLNIDTNLINAIKRSWLSDYGRRVTNKDVEEAISRWLEENLPFR